MDLGEDTQLILLDLSAALDILSIIPSFSFVFKIGSALMVFLLIGSHLISLLALKQSQSMIPHSTSAFSTLTCGTSKNVVWQSADGRVTSDHCHVTVQRLFSKFCYLLETSKKRCLTVGRWSRDLRPLSRDRSVTLKKKSNCLKHPKTLFDSRPTVAWPQPLSRDCSATFFKNSSNCLIPRKTVVWQSADGRVSSDLVGTSKKCCLKVSGLSRDGPALLFLWFFPYGFTYCLADVYLVSIFFW